MELFKIIIFYTSLAFVFVLLNMMSTRVLYKEVVKTIFLKH